MPRIKKLTDYSYSPTNPASEDAIRAQIDDSIQEVYDASAKNTDTVNLTGNQTITDVKTFSASPIVPDPTTDFQVANKKGVDTIQTNLNTHKTSTDHDGRYFTETEVNALLLANQQGNHLGTWQGYSPTQTDPGIQSVVDAHTNKFSDISYNPRDYGANADGVTYDDFAFRNLIISAMENLDVDQGFTIRLQTGKSYLLGSIDNPLGNPYNNRYCKVVIEGNGAIIVWRPQGDFNMINGQGTRNSHYKNFGINAIGGNGYVTKNSNMYYYFRDENAAFDNQNFNTLFENINCVGDEFPTFNKIFHYDGFGLGDRMTTLACNFSGFKTSFLYSNNQESVAHNILSTYISAPCDNSVLFDITKPSSGCLFVSGGGCSLGGSKWYTVDGHGLNQTLIRTGSAGNQWAQINFNKFRIEQYNRTMKIADLSSGEITIEDSNFNMGGISSTTGAWDNTFAKIGSNATLRLIRCVDFAGFIDCEATLNTIKENFSFFKSVVIDDCKFAGLGTNSDYTNSKKPRFRFYLISDPVTLKNYSDAIKAFWEIRTIETKNCKMLYENGEMSTINITYSTQMDEFKSYKLIIGNRSNDGYSYITSGSSYKARVYLPAFAKILSVKLFTPDNGGAKHLRLVTSGKLTYTDNILGINRGVEMLTTGYQPIYAEDFTSRLMRFEAVTLDHTTVTTDTIKGYIVVEYTCMSNLDDTVAGFAY